MKKESGFTLLEMVVVIAVIGILSAIAIPNFIAWLSNRRVNSAARQMVSLLQNARIEAARAGANVVVTFDPDGNSVIDGNYEVFVDDGEGTGDADLNGRPDGWGNGTHDAGERTIAADWIPPGVILIDTPPPFGGGAGETRFDSRGMPNQAGPIRLTNSRGHTLIITLSRGGSVRVE